MHAQLLCVLWISGSGKRLAMAGQVGCNLAFASANQRNTTTSISKCGRVQTNDQDD
jgi:hypothetical protein